MNNFVFYILNRAWFRFVEFWRHWYWHGFLIVSRKTLDLIRALDRRLAIKINLKNIFQPLYQDYTFLGYIFGFMGRAVLIVGASVIYGFILLLAAAVYLVWAMIPLYVLLRIVD